MVLKEKVGMYICGGCGEPENSTLQREIDPYPCPVCGVVVCNSCQVELSFSVEDEATEQIVQFHGRLCKRHLTKKLIKSLINRRNKW